MSRFNKIANLHRAVIEAGPIQAAAPLISIRKSGSTSEEGEASMFGVDLSSYSKIILSRSEIVRISESDQPSSPVVFAKPNGLWYGCGTEWLEFAESGLSKYREKINYIYELELSESVLRIANEDDLKTFYWHFSVPIKRGDHHNPIDWKEVATEYSGIEICPYLPSMRMEYNWYYPWDAASGCIWSQKGVRNLNLIAKRS